jgi:salicylate hydroxylase
MFVEFAKNAGVQFRYNTQVVSVDPWAGVVITSKGSRLTADVIVGADGYKSVVRPVVVGPEGIQGVLDKRISVKYVLLLLISRSLRLTQVGALSLTIPTSLMRQHQDLVALTVSPEVRWLTQHAVTLLTPK